MKKLNRPLDRGSLKEQQCLLVWSGHIPWDLGCVQCSVPPLRSTPLAEPMASHLIVGPTNKEPCWTHSVVCVPLRSCFIYTTWKWPPPLQHLAVLGDTNRLRLPRYFLHVATPTPSQPAWARTTRHVTRGSKPRKLGALVGSRGLGFKAWRREDSKG